MYQFITAEMLSEMLGEMNASQLKETTMAPGSRTLIRVTVDDPKAYTKPWTVTLHQRIVVDAELIDEVCLENEQFVQRMNLDY